MSSSSNGPNKVVYFLSGFADTNLIHKSLLMEICKFDEEYFPNPWKADVWESLLKESKSKYLLGLSHENFKLQGMILLGLSDPDTAHLYKILTHPSERRSGLGIELLRGAVAQVKELGFKTLYLEVELTNFSAISFYKKQGFRVLVIKKDFYGSMRDAWAMELSL